MTQTKPAEFYHDLVQAQAVDKEIKLHLDAIQENKQRVEFLEKQRSQKNDELQEQNQTLETKTHENSELEKELAAIDKKIEKSNEHIASATNQQQADAINKELETLVPRKDELENNILELIDEIDQVKASISEGETFLEGSAKTLNEIKSEVETANNEEEKKIEILEQRIENLLSLIPAQYKTAFLEAQAEHRFQNPIAFIDNSRNCNQCRFAVDIVIQENVNKGLSPEKCTSCSRLLLPLSASSSS